MDPDLAIVYRGLSGSRKGRRTMNEVYHPGLREDRVMNGDGDGGGT